MLNFFSWRNKRPSQRRANRRTFRPLLESLENRSLLSTFTVYTNGDSGLSTLRQAILNANSTPNVGGPDVIDFDLGFPTISLLSPLPAITEAVIIDGTTQSGYAGTPLVQLDGAGAGSASGLLITAANSTVRGLVINRFSGDGIYISPQASNVTVQGNYIGTNASGTAAMANGVFGVEIDGAASNTIDSNLISGNGNHGIIIRRAGASLNVVQGNYVGTDVTGTLPLGNLSGVVVEEGAHDNRIGTDGNGANDAAELNIISGNRDFGVAIWQVGTNQNTVAGNYIGLAPDGTTEVGNGQDGVWINNASANTIGGTTAPRAT